VVKLDGDDVAIYKLPMIERNVHGFEVADPSVNASCGAVDDEMVSAKRGDVVPIPTTGFVTPFTKIPRLSVVVENLDAAEPVPEPHAEPVADTVPSALAWRQREPVPPSDDTVRFVVEARVAVTLVVEAYGATSDEPENVRNALDVS